MSTSMSRQELLEKLGKMGYVKTQSGPVVSAKKEMIDTITKGVPKKVKDQTKEKWDRRKYENHPLTMNKNYLNLKDIGVKIVTESRSRALTEAGELNFNIDLPVLNQESLSGKFKCLGHDFVIQVVAPNDNGEISISLEDETTGKTSLHSFSPESDEMKGNLANVIKRTAVDMVKNADTASSYDEMMGGVGAATGFVGNDNFNDVNFNDLNVAEMGPSALVKNESVDWQLEALRDICDRAVMEAGGNFGPDDFAAPEDPNSTQNQGPTPDPNAQVSPQGAGDVNSDPTAPSNGNAKKMVEFTTFCDPGVGDEGSGLSQKAVDTLNKIIAAAYTQDLEDDSSGVRPDEDEIYNGWAGTTAQPRDVAVSTFLKFKKYAALGNQELPVDGLVKMAEALEDGIDYKTFNQRLGQWFPEVYNEDGTSITDVDAQTAAMHLPGDDTTGTGVGFDPNAPIGDPNGGMGGTADMMGIADDLFGEPGTEMKEGDSGEEMDNVDFDLAALDKI